MKTYKLINKIIKSYISLKYDNDNKASSEFEISQYLGSLMNLLKEMGIIVEYSIEFKEKFKELDLIPCAIFYSLDENKMFLIDLLL